jgi:hypothetical protein
VPNPFASNALASEKLGHYHFTLSCLLPSDLLAMSSTALSEARHRFASALDELRRKYQAVFASWLAGALNEETTFGWEAVSRQIALTRKAFIDEFIDLRAPAIVEILNPRAKLDINRQLKLFEQDPVDQLSAQHELSADRHSRPRLMRTVVGAAVGAAVALLVLAPQTNELNSGAPADGQSIDGQRSVPPIKHRRLGQTAALPLPDAGQAKPLNLSFTQIVIGAIGASIGVFLVACPPVQTWLAFLGNGRTLPVGSGKAGVPFATARRISLATALGAVVAAAGCAIGVLFVGAQQLSSALFVVAALLCMALARWGVFFRPPGQHESMRLLAMQALDRELLVDLNTWSAFSVGLIARPVTVGIDPKVDQIRTVIVARRGRNDAPENILRVIEQELKLPPGGSSVTTEASEFIWAPNAAEQYNVVGVVNVGDIVTVLTPPRFGDEANGVREIVQKGQVMRKRTSD